MIRARYGRLWTLAAVVILIIVFFSGARPSVPLKTPELPSWFPTRQQQEAFREKVENAAPPEQLAPGLGEPAPLVPQELAAEEEEPEIAATTTTTSTKEPTPSPVLEQPVAEVPASHDADLLAAHKALAEHIAADVDDVAVPEKNIVHEVAMDMADEHMDEYGNTVEKPRPDMNDIVKGIAPTPTTQGEQATKPTPFDGAYAQSHTPAAPQKPKTSGSPSDADLELLNLAQPGIQPESNAPQDGKVETGIVADAAVMIQTAPSTPPDGEAPAKVKRSKTVVVGRLHDEDTSWISEELKDWQSAIYYTDLPEDAIAPSGLRTRMNKAREAMPYLTYIIDHYPNFPDVVAFIHPHRVSWHNDAKYNSAVNMLNGLKLSTVQARGYVNLRCNNQVGCPDEIQPFRSPPHADKTAEHAYSRVYAHFFRANEAEMRKQIPVVGTQCCAQFAVSKEELLKRPREDYERYRAYLEQTEYSDDTIGRVMEYMWHIIFGREPVHCEDTFECWCQVYGRCFVSELDKSWTGWLGITAHPDVKGPED